MKALSRAIDRFCRKNPRFGIPWLMRYIVAISAIIFVLNMMDERRILLTLLHFNPAGIFRGEVWRIITWIFIPQTNQPIFGAITLFFYYFVGTTLEREWGKAKFTVYYLLGILINILYGFIAIIVLRWPVLLNPLYLNLSLFFAFAVLFPEHTIRLFLIIPVKMKWAALLSVVFFAISMISNLLVGSFGMAFLPLVAILNFIIVCGDDLLTLLRPLRARGQSQFSNFNRETKKAKRNMESSSYRHKCAVCGKTDTEYPELEFRYCSRCEGFHCFCIDHINNHVHFQ